ncbi:MAG: glutamine--fructose-6-phosphate aminotransferase, partial [Gemmatimonadales bacterium]|nr:glutamine--fructose-6-phosphate aminotransferase [Gemmatimonadales bacterium]
MGYVGGEEAAPIILDGLARLEYRGYDSAGIAVLDDEGRLRVAKGVGKLAALRASVANNLPAGHAGIGHTRWATHGRATEANAHPHADSTGDILVIHNGIVENYRELRDALAAGGHTFASETDTEVIPHLIEDGVKKGLDLAGAVREAVGQIEGAAAIVAMRRQEPGVLVAARVANAGGVVIGYGASEMLVASDLPAILPHTQRVVFLEDGEIARITT